jgi:hypothetical protein
MLLLRSLRNHAIYLYNMQLLLRFKETTQYINIKLLLLRS